MTRQEDQLLDREQLKQEIKEEIKHDGRRKRIITVLITLFVMLAILSTPFLIVAVMAAKTGFVQIPVLTGWLYQPSNPTRLVVPLVGSDTETILNSAIARVDYNPNFNSLNFYLTEKELTTLLSSVINSEDKNPLPFQLDSVQAVLEDDRIEVYALTDGDNDSKVPILVSFVPRAEGGQLTIESVDVKIGAFKVPNFLAGLVVGSAANNLAGSVNSMLGDAGR
ncbi:hypothetical protein KKE28_01900, partial [Patescibacteria group bacterium]|nr:hypothetical protein [Patescibacteria group bacterium]